MNIYVQSKKVISELNNFWNHIHFHPTDAIEDSWGKAVLDHVAEAAAAEYVRIYAMLEDIVTRGENGELKYDFSLNDKRMDYMVEKGFKLLVCFNFMPAAIAMNPYQVSAMDRYKGKRINFSEPADYREWQEVCKVYVQHIVDRYGMDEVSTWYLHCWNEPDHSYWLDDNRADVKEVSCRKVQEYKKLYDFFAEAVSQVSGKIRIGGPSAAHSLQFIEEFIKHTQEEENHANGGKGTKLDFISIHTYSMGVGHFAQDRHPSVGNMLKKTSDIYDLMKKYRCHEKEILVDEWCAVSGGFEGKSKYPQLVYRDNEYYPAFYARMIDTYIRELHDKQIPVSKMMVCLSGQHYETRDFEGYRSFFTVNHFPKPIFNGYVLMAKLGNLLLEKSCCDIPEEMGVIPTMDSDGNIKIAIYYMSENMKKKLPNVKVHLSVGDLEGNYTMKHYRIDKVNSNSYTKWLELGMPEKPDHVAREEIKEAGKLSLLYPEYQVNRAADFDEDIVLSQNSISLIELIKMK